MSINTAIIAELKQEGANTRKQLERVPMDKSDWKPHAKSMSLGRLATHIAELPSWITMTINKDELDFANGDYKPFVAASAEDLVKLHDGYMAEAIATLEKATDDDMMKPWTLKSGDHIIFTMPKVAVIRNMVLNHFIHHRGQLTVYLRMNYVPLVGMYGPTADEMQ